MRITVLGVPSSAAAYCVGVENAPAALRAHGLVDALTAHGHEVVDVGDLTTRRWAPDPANPFLQNLDDEAESVRETAETAAPLLAEGERLLLIGGSCITAVGMCAAMAGSGRRPKLIYIDRHLDLNTPLTTVEGSLSWMGMAHALAVEGAAAELIPSDAPLLRPSDLAYLGVDLADTTDGERAHLQRLVISVTPQSELTDHPREAAQAARAALAPGPFAVHVDVDVLDFLDAPIAENPNGRNTGPTIAQLGGALDELLRDPDCLGLSLGQLDPAHAASDPTALPRLIGAIGRAITHESVAS